MKKLLLLVFALFSFTVSTSATNIPGGIVSGTWTLSGSPYNVQGSIQIPNDSTLTIQPGVSVIFLGAYKLNVQGRLLAIGTITDTIIFTTSDTATRWKGIRFVNTDTTNDTSKIIYCKLQYGNATGTTPDNYGGAIYFSNFSKGIISRSSIIYNKANTGGGIYCNNCSPLISNNIISHNSAAMHGGGICCQSGNPVIINNVISFNSADHFGGGIYSNLGGLNISYNTISNNTAITGGGGIKCSGNILINNNNITNNMCDSSSGTGGGISSYSGSPTIINNSIANNNAAKGGALYCNQANPIFRNCILWGNIASISGSQVFLNDDASDPNFYYCNVQGGSAAFELNGNFYSGTYLNNLNTDPLFVSPTGGSGIGYDGLNADWSLQNISPCIDAGDPNGTYTATDIAGNPRVNVCRIDIGAYEYQTGTPSFTTSLYITHPILCNETTGEITAVVSGGTLPYTYLWSNGQTTDTAVGLVAGTYSVTVSTASYGCTIIDSITLAAPVTISVDAGSPLSVVCGDSAQLGCSVFPMGTPVLTYQWSPAIGLNSDTIPNPKAAISSNNTYYVTVTTSNGCSAVDSVNIISSLTITANNITLNCGDNTATLNTTTNYTGTDTLIYSWLPIAGLDNPNIANPIATIDSNQTYTVTVSTLHGCYATDDLSISIIPMNAPEICIVGVDSSNKNMIVWNKPISTAIDSFYIFKETNISGVYAKIGATAYNDLSVFVDTASHPENYSNKYKISIHDDCGFESDKSAYHKTMHLAINQGMGTTWNLIWEMYEGFAVSTYNIYRGTTPSSLTLLASIAGGGTTQYTDNTPPSGYVYYQIEVMGATACNPSKSFSSSLSNIASTQYVGIENYSNGIATLSIHPNPACDNIEISVSEISQVEIMSAEGQILKSFKMNADHASIDVTAFAAGVYFVKAINDKGFVVRKFIKE